jgi:hypothetical protein
MNQKTKINFLEFKEKKKYFENQKMNKTKSDFS